MKTITRSSVRSMKSGARRPVDKIQTASLSIIVILIIFRIQVSAQLYEISLPDKVSHSSLIVEGKVVDQFSFWNKEHTLIYTSNLVRVSKIFEGTMAGKEIEVITKGGQVDGRFHHHSHLLELSVGDIGLFFCEDSPVRNSARSFDGERTVEVYSSMQGFFSYDLEMGTATVPFHSYPDLEKALYPEVTRLTGKTYTSLLSLRSLNSVVHRGKGQTRTSAAPTISTFAPSTVTGGTRDVIVITGTNFGATRGTGYVSFKNADNGGTTYISPAAWEYVSWTDTEIRVHVPTKAGTGTIQVTNSDPLTVTSGSSLTVTYSIITGTFSGVVRRLRLIDDNGNGGYSFRMHTEFNGTSSAKAAFLRALKNWRCSTSVSGGVNFDLGATTSTDASVSDGINVIRYDNGSELAAGVLGLCSWYGASATCSGPDTNSYVNELDLTFDDGAAWYYGTGTPGGSQSDFESVALHELGHAHQLAHVIDASAVMHYSLTLGTTRRALSSNDLAAGNNVLTLSTTTTVCGKTKMSAVTANAGPDTIICPGGSANLSAMGGITYLWTPSTGLSADTIPDPVASPAVTTTYTVSITNGTCVSTSDAVTVTVAAGAPAANAGIDKSICVGDSTDIGVTDALSVTGTIGTGSSTNTTFIFNTSVEDHKAQVLFTKAELNTAGISGKRYISKVAFQFSSIAGTKPMSSFELAMGNTSATDFTTKLQSVTLVCSRASYIPAVGWDTLSLDTPFLWDGLSNLVVQACFNNSGSPSSSGYATKYTVAGTGTIAWNAAVDACTNTSSWSYSSARPNIWFIASPNMYTWSPTTGLRFPVDSKPTASPGSSTVYTVTLKDSNGCINTDPMTLSVFPTDPTSLVWTGAVNTSWSTVGNWDAPCAIPTTGDVVTIPLGTTPPAGIPAMTLGGVTINNAAGTSLSGDVSITGTLTLTSGNITLGSNHISIGASGGLSGGSASSFIVTDGTGELRQANIGSGGKTGTIAFPVGSGAGSYAPASIDNSGGTADEFRIRVTSSVLTGGTSGTPITADVVKRTWHINEATAGGSSATVGLQWNGGDEGTTFDRALCAINVHNGSAWSALQSFGPAGGTNPYTRSVSGVTSFGPFGVGDAASPLPVELVAFSAVSRADDVLLSWQTIAETNNLYFTVQRTLPGEQSWSSIGRVYGHGTSDQSHGYSFLDAAVPAASRIVYRLQQTDRDGSSTFSDLVEVDRAPGARIDLRQNHPNPFSESTGIQFTIPVGAYVSLRVHDARGRIVATLTDGVLDAGSHSYVFNADRLPGGIYFSVLQTGPERIVRTMTVMR